jgi:hypothetical protein
MAKPALGRGLKELMDGDKVASASPVIAPTTNGSNGSDELFGRGVQSLLKQSDSAVQNAQKPAMVLPDESRFVVPSWFFFGIDLLLLALALALMLGPQPLRTWNVVLAFLATGLGCCSAIAGIYTSRNH